MLKLPSQAQQGPGDQRLYNGNYGPFGPNPAAVAALLSQLGSMEGTDNSLVGKQAANSPTTDKPIVASPSTAAAVVPLNSGDNAITPLQSSPFVSNYNNCWGATAAFLTNYMQHFWQGNNGPNAATANSTYLIPGGNPEWDVYLKEMQAFGRKCDSRQQFKECPDTWKI